MINLIYRWKLSIVSAISWLITFGITLIGGIDSINDFHKIFFVGTLGIIMVVCEGVVNGFAAMEKSAD